jgi:hypothetical protein
MGLAPLSSNNSSSSIPLAEKRANTPAEMLAKKKLAVLQSSVNQDVFEDGDDSDEDIEIDVSDLVVRVTPAICPHFLFTDRRNSHRIARCASCLASGR